ncbi:MAG: hypothetical protein ACKOOL_03775 [Novosphingobium sp.]
MIADITELLQARPMRSAAALPLIASALLGCSGQNQQSKQNSRLVSLASYTHDLSCWGQVEGGRISITGKAIITKVAQQRLAIFPISKNCHLSHDDAVGLAYLNVRIGSVIRNVVADRILQGRSLDPWLSSEHSYINKSSTISDLTASCRPGHAEREPTSLILSDCELIQVAGSQPISQKSIDSIGQN